jgi:hypothetical protein
MTSSFRRLRHPKPVNALSEHDRQEALDQFKAQKESMEKDIRHRWHLINLKHNKGIELPPDKGDKQ